MHLLTMVDSESRKWIFHPDQISYAMGEEDNYMIVLRTGAEFRIREKDAEITPLTMFYNWWSQALGSDDG